MVAYGSHYFVFRTNLSRTEQILYEVYVCIVWLSYYLAIVVDPGSPPKNFTPKAGEWRRWCKKCQNYKPERSHHCKTCNKCVLKMDHHCPWTYNCVGHNNLPHFLRFVFFLIVGMTYVLFQLGKQVLHYYDSSKLPSYLIDKKEMCAVIFLLPVTFFVFVSIIILFVRCMINLLFRGMTQIEVWEMERIGSQFHTESLWLQIRKNYFKLHGKEMPHLVSWNRTTRYYEVDENSNNDNSNENNIVPKDFTSDDIVFPYDLGVLSNMINACDYPWMWLLPWGGPRENGYHFQKNEFMEDDQLGLPWPPDGGHQEPMAPVDDDFDISDSELQDMPSLRRRLDPRNNMTRSEWMNDLGETLDDFGVDLDAEDIEHDDLVSKDEISNN